MVILVFVTLSAAMPDMHHIPILHNVVFAFKTQCAFGAGIGFGAGFKQLLPADCFSANEVFQPRECGRELSRRGIHLPLQ